MLNFELLPGDKYEGRCAEIYITEKQFLIYHCSVCDEIYVTFNELLCHITKDHYENTKEYSKMEARSVETIVTKENDSRNQLTAKELILLKAKKYHNFDRNLVVENNRVERKCEHLLKTRNEITEIKDTSETGEMQPLFNPSKTFVQSNKLMESAIERTKINALTRYQVISNEKRRYICAICGFAFKEKYNLRSHLLRHSNNKKVSTCSLCPKKFFNKVELRLNEYCHKGERPYFCDDCGIGFISSESLIRHIIRLHSIQRSLKCEGNLQCPDCLLTFKYKEAINNTPKLHGNEQKFRCENCDLELSNAVAFNNIQKQEENCIYQSEQEFERYTIKDTIEHDIHKHVKRGRLKEKTIETEFDLEQNTDEHESKD